MYSPVREKGCEQEKEEEQSALGVECQNWTKDVDSEREDPFFKSSTVTGIVQGLQMCTISQYGDCTWYLICVRVSLTHQ